MNIDRVRLSLKAMDAANYRGHRWRALLSLRDPDAFDGVGATLRANGCQ